MNPGIKRHRAIVKRLRNEYGIRCRVDANELADLVTWGLLSECDLFARMADTKAESV